MPLSTGLHIDINTSKRIGFVRLIGLAFAFALPICQADEGTHDFFESRVRPIFVDKCGRCHGNEKQSGGLRLDSRQSLIQGGTSGAAIVAGHPAESLLIRSVRRLDGLAMPPDQPLDDASIAALQRWVELGANWPDSIDPAVRSQADPKHHWAFQSLERPSVPRPPNTDPLRSPIDSLVGAKLAEQNLTAAPVANRRVLIRRVTYALTGLPPSPADVARFVIDPDPLAYEKLVDRLLESGAYGEHWARRWLDVARYSDTKGYVYGREERFWTHAWVYRDWVVHALNSDMPYDRFLLLQLAADQVSDRDQGDLAAMGFLTLGRRFLGVNRDIIDDRIDVVCRGTMGLTVACARCHNHKYDPIPTADYYSLYGVFDSCVENLVQLETTIGDPAFVTELQKRQTELADTLNAARDESSERARLRIADYLFAQSELDKYPANGFDQIFSKEDLLPAFVRQWERFLRDPQRRNDRIFAAWHRYSQIPAESFSRQTVKATEQVRSGFSGDVHPTVSAAFEQSPDSFRAVCNRYGELFADVNREWESLLDQARDSGSDPPAGLPDSDREALRQVLYGPQSACQVPDGPITESETYFDSATCTSLWKLQGEVDRWIINSKTQVPFALTLNDHSTPTDARVFRRGNPLNQGDEVPRQFLAVLAGEQRRPFQDGSGRLELARAIIDPENPLTARVIVNRIWRHHFGHGLVSTPSDFGTRADVPSHPKLLDWLASELLADHWSLKRLHRKIVLSKTYQQSSSGPADPAMIERAMQIDPDNRLLWMANARRLTFEEFRDSLLACTDELETTVGGKPAKLFEPPYPKRRTLYGLVDRQYLPGTLRMFDFANPDLHVPQRSETTVPQQALFFMNHPLVLERSRALAEWSRQSEDPRERVRILFRQVLQRPPTDIEIDDALALVDAAPQAEPDRAATAGAWGYGYGTFDEQTDSVAGFTPLPHFTGQAWQGGPKWPDSKLGWVQLTADGGHPGNDRNHAAIRRWTAPRDMTVSIQSALSHTPTQGDGIRAFVISSQGGVQHAISIHHDVKQIGIKTMNVSKHDTIDFLVDIGDVLNSDQYHWKVTIQEKTGEQSPLTWDSVSDFDTLSVKQLDGWEQLAQVMLCSNEFMFVD